MRDILADLRGLCDHLQWPRVAVVAHDWGGAAARQWAIAHPERDPGPAALVLQPSKFRVRVPTLVLCGEADTALPLRLLDGLSELVDDLTIEELPGATHWLAHEEPERIAAAVRAFCGAS